MPVETGNFMPAGLCRDDRHPGVHPPEDGALAAAASILLCVRSRRAHNSWLPVRTPLVRDGP